MMIALLFLFYFGVPAILLWAAKRMTWIDKVGAVTLCYIIGIIVGNIPGVHVSEEYATPLMSVAVMLAIPLLLFSSDFTVWRKMGPTLTMSFLFCVIAVAIAVIAGTLLFKDLLGNSWIVGSMLMGVYTGGTPNLTAIGLSLGIDNDSLVIVNGAEMLFGAIWLLFTLSTAKPVLSRFLRSPSSHADVQFGLDEHLYWKTSPIALALGIVIAGIAFGVSSLVFDQEEPWFLASVFLLVTSLGIAGSLIGKVRTLPGAYGLGNYLLLIFCVAIGSQADIATIFGSAPVILGIVAFVMFTAITLHLILCFVFKIDVETFIIASAAGIFGPQFIPPVAKAIGNPYLIPVGLALGVLGLAVGNFLGLGISNLLRLF